MILDINSTNFKGQAALRELENGKAELAFNTPINKFTVGTRISILDKTYVIYDIKNSSYIKNVFVLHLIEG